MDHSRDSTSHFSAVLLHTCHSHSEAINNRILAIEIVPVGLRTWCILYAEAGWLTGVFFSTENDSSDSFPSLKNLQQSAKKKALSTSENASRHTVRAFLDSNIHGISVQDHLREINDDDGDNGDGQDDLRWKKIHRICIYGDHSLRLLSLHCDNASKKNKNSEFPPTFQQFISPTCGEKLAEDLIMTVKFLDGNRIGALLAHNSVSIFDDTSLDLIFKVRCMDSSILYSALLLGVNSGDLVAIGGTVCNYLCFWAPVDGTNHLAPAIHKLCGHSGVVFSIDYNHCLHLLCSTSDDRSCRVYHCDFKDDVIVGASPTVSQWKKAEFVFLHALYGHEARVWRGKFLSEFIVTVGEDTRCCIWDEEGKLLSQWSSHGGINAWSCAVLENTDSMLVFTGGADGGISVREIQKRAVETSSRTELKSSVSPGNIRVRRLAVIDEVRFMVLVDGGLLYLVDVSCDGRWTLKWDEANLKQCVALRYNQSADCVAVITCTGRICLIKPNSEPENLSWTLDLAVNCMEALWADNSTLIVSGPSGFIHIVAYQAEVLTLSGTLPLSGKNLWITAAARKHSLLFCGDRSGSLRVFCENKNENGIWKDIHVGLHVHGQNEISQITLPDDDKEKLKKTMITAGRSGDVITWRYGQNGSDRIVIERLRVVQPDKEVVEWVSGFHILAGAFSDSIPRMLIFGFRSTKFAAVDLSSGKTVLEVDCGGGHRSSSTILFDQSASLRFAFVKSNGINWIDGSTSDIATDRLELKEAMHGLQIWSVQGLSSSGESTRNLFLATGSEDTSMKIIKMTREGYNQPVSPSVVADCRGHLSSVRVVKASIKFEKCIYTAGGRTQLLCWKCMDETWSENVVQTTQWTPYPVVRKQWCDKSLIDPDTRIMDLDVCQFEKFELVAAGSSDGCIRIFALGSPFEITLIGEITQFSWCILHTRLVVLEGEILLLTSGTNGYLVTMNPTLSVKEKLSELGDFGETDVFKFPSGKQSHSVKCHQSGVDAIDILMESGSHFLRIATGGDDSAICILIFDPLTSQDPTIMVRFHEEKAHSAQVSGLKFLQRDLLLSASKDQLIKIWNVDYEKKKLHLKGCVYTSVADVSCISLLARRRQTDPADAADSDQFSKTKNSNCTLVAVVGAGFELLNLDSFMVET